MGIHRGQPPREEEGGGGGGGGHGSFGPRIRSTATVIQPELQQSVRRYLSDRSESLAAGGGDLLPAFKQNSNGDLNAIDDLSHLSHNVGHNGDYYHHHNVDRSTESTWPSASSSDSAPTGGVSGMLKDPMVQLFGIVFILFLLTAILATINFCIWYLERRRRRVPLHWRSSPGVEASISRPVSQTPKRSFHIQHALYKTVRRPSAMPP